MVDLGLVKNQRFAGDQNIQVRIEVFNLLNRANFSIPVDDLYVFDAAGPIASAGRLRSTATTARQVQLGVKFVF